MTDKAKIIDLKALRALCDAATDGGEPSAAHGHFIAATDPQTVRALIDEIESLRDELEEIKPYSYVW